MAELRGCGIRWSPSCRLLSRRRLFAIWSGRLPRCSGFLFERTRFVNLARRGETSTISPRTRNHFAPSPGAHLSWMMSLASGYFSGVSCPGATRLLPPCPSPDDGTGYPTSCLWSAAPSAGGILRRGHPTYTCAVPPGHPSHTLCVVPTFGSSKVCAAETRDLCEPICKGIPGTDAYMRPAKAPLNPVLTKTGDRPPDPSRHSRPHQEKLQTKSRVTRWTGEWSAT
ncbi:hypothetical protein B0T18DRAFT_99110 [Schizothecium vesticola]|uniref:Uncharacterized protein n=1 Tax=Schizothecium vesticola TaxID=314040 RepID=A0AA40F0Z2_9PEZI|nr:hypothetical protein B0T18DRAFT_99110 [Schizothecium vesticola]